MHNLVYKRMCSEDDTDIPQLVTIHQIPEIAQYLSISDNYFHYVTNNEYVEQTETAALICGGGCTIQQIKSRTTF